MAAKTLTRPQAEALRTAEIHTEGVREDSAIFERYVIDARPNTLAVLVRLGVAEVITLHIGVEREEHVFHVLTYAGELIRATIEPGGNLPRLDSIAYTVEHAVRPTTDEYEGYALAKVADGWHVVNGATPVTLDPFADAATAADFIRRTVNGPRVESGKDVLPASANAEILATMFGVEDPAPWAQPGVRIYTAGWGKGTVTRRDIQCGGGEAQHVVLYHADADTEGRKDWLITAASQQLARLCTRCGTVGDDSMPGREMAGDWLCGYCAVPPATVEEVTALLEPRTWEERATQEATADTATDDARGLAALEALARGADDYSAPYTVHKRRSVPVSTSNPMGIAIDRERYESAVIAVRVAMLRALEYGDTQHVFCDAITYGNTDIVNVSPEGCVTYVNDYANPVRAHLAG